MLVEHFHSNKPGVINAMQICDKNDHKLQYACTVRLIAVLAVGNSFSAHNKDTSNI